MSSLLIQNAQIVTEAQTYLGACLVKDRLISALFDQPFPEQIQAQSVIDAAGKYLAPGLIDLQLNGAFGYDFTQTPETIWPVAARLPELGLTGFLPTIITSPLAKSNQAQQVLKQRPEGFAGTIPLGLHLEGPFLNPLKKGAHNPNHILPADEAPAEELADWSAENGVSLVTLAPEMVGGIPLIKRLVEQGVVVSAGHSMATFDEAQEAFDAGISYVTHLFNAMPPLHHHEPGLAAAALASSFVTIGIIPDGVHVHPELVGLVWQLAGGRVNGVTDAMGAMGSSP
ncbi:MAG: N-acetylglucosamine-6-phosphate deacetylase, partial [Chloroflexota bacterium]